MAAPVHVPDLTGLALLVAIARTGNLGTAAHELGLSVQAATARVRSVEQLVGTPVLERGRRGRRSSRLTPRGVLLVEWAGPVLDAAHDLDAAVATLRPPDDGTDAVVLAAGPTAAESLLPGWLVELRDGPGGRITLLDTADPAAAVRDGDAVVGIVETGGPLDGLHATTVASDTLVLVVPPGHPLAGGPGIDGAGLAGTPLVSRRPEAGSRPVLDAALRDAAGDSPVAAPIRELAADAAVRAAVRGGDGPAVLPRMVVAADIATGLLLEVPVHGVELTREFRAVWQQGTSPQGTARDLLRIATGGRIR
ncbi:MULTISPECIES: LysR family transcriptional regulator [Pseudonocardia]|uniref:HTH-type transcriptional regulator CysL n=2 Tax=Pseudonocardia TaxID=1847 RepID=A0A1Y2N6Y1_PSEAH|nr:MULTISPECIES: LysR family transcriptional regulator [Pseudonocardia]OSY43232.1 HTH-type transcriptional regulator CysL [Pseudonocardia autotrophica]TDN71720.1 molybdate transport repressor ModE-like protein [Pseudonocardia autotrophica]BBG02407.1 LysR family transcriptional regulator [Pseudonocardia autotrophica]GEC23257.1 LysR family transcriptional regulator [Pseudonocardia saturnea]